MRLDCSGLYTKTDQKYVSEYTVDYVDPITNAAVPYTEVSCFVVFVFVVVVVVVLLLLLCFHYN